jgi:hypothetical protein
MKDYYMQKGQLKAGYNVQIATQGRFKLAYSLFSNPTDTRPITGSIMKKKIYMP